MGIRAAAGGGVRSSARQPVLGRGVLVFVVAFAAFATLAPTASAALRDFSLRYGENVRGNITFAANTLMRCPVTDVDTCLRGAVHDNPALNNNARRMQRLDVDGVVDLDGDGSDDTETSSRAILTIPPEAEVLFAGLYWAGNVVSPGNPPAGLDENDPDDREEWLNTLIDTPAGGGYEEVTGTELDTVDYGTSPSIGREWNSFADVTDIVRAAGPGEYTVGGVPLFPNTTFTNGVSSFGGWALWVAYEDPSQPWRNLSVFDGYQGPGQTFDVSGFTTPPSGSFNTTVGVSSVEGDGATTGDAMRINGIALFDPLTPNNNFFNSRITRFGVDDGDRTPNFLNQLGWDAKLIDADAVNANIIPNGATSAEVALTSSGDQYSANAIATAIDIFNPDVSVEKAVQNVDRPASIEAFRGEELEYTLTVENATGSASDTAADVILRDAVPEGTTYVPGSLEMVSGDPAPTGGRTDATGDDSAELDGDEVVFRLGDGADSTNGGDLAPGESATVGFRVTVDDDFPSGESVLNDAVVDFTGDTTGEELDATSNEVETPVTERQTNLELAKTATSVVDPEDPVSWILTVTNNGPDASTGATVTDTLPAGVTNIQAPGCDVQGSVVTCEIGALAVNASTQIAITGDAPDAPSTCFENDASVAAHDVDPDPADNDASARTCTTPAADLELEKIATPVVDPGGSVTWTLTVRNNGPDASTGATVTDTLPAGVTNIQAPGCDVQDSTVSCDVGPLTSGATTAIAITGDAPDTPATCFENDATVDGAEGDPLLANNDASARSCTPPAADLDLAKTATALVDPGEPIAWTLTVTNNGPNQSSGSTVTDTLPAGVTAIASPTPGCDVAGNTVTCDVGPLNPGGSTQITITGDAPDTPSSCFENDAAIAGDEGDPVSENDRATARTCTTPAADLEVAKTADTLVDPGDPVTWTLTVTNNGPDASTGATVTDTLPSAVTNVGTQTSGCNVVGNIVTCDVGALDPDESAEIVITGNAPDAPATCVENDATVDGVEGDQVLGNNDASARTCTTPAADLELTKSAAASVAPGGQVTWTLTVTNHGPNASTASTVTDTLPAAITGVQAPGCEVVGNAITCDVGPLDVDGSSEITVTGDAPEITSTCFENDASVTGDEADPVLANNAASAETCTAAAADLELEKSAPAAVDPGGEMTWTLTATNHGPDASTASTVTDTLPTEVANVQSSTPGCTVQGNTVSCDVGPLTVDGSAEIVITGDAPQTSSTCLENAAGIEGAEHDPVGQNDVAAVETCTRPAAPPSGKPRLTIKKRASDDTARRGEVISYKITVRNKGKATARRVRVCDKLPSGQKLLSAPGGDKRSTSKVCWLVKRLRAGAKRSFKVVTQIEMGAKLGKQTNKAFVKGANAKRNGDVADIRVAPTPGTCRVLGPGLARC